MAYAFISYSSHQQRQLNQVKEYLKSNGISYWAAPDDIPIGSKYSEVIKQAIANASCVLFLLSDRSQNSTYCKLEIALALKLEKTIIPIQLEDVILNDDFSLYLCRSDFFPLPGKIPNAKTTKLLNQLKLLCTDPDQSPAEPVDPSYKLGWFRKGTWLQLFGWIWVIGGYKPFYVFAELCFPVPPYIDANHYVTEFNGPPMIEMGLKCAFLITALMLIGLFSICYGFSLNRKLRKKERLFFRQFSLCQMLLLAACVCWGISFRVSMVHIEGYRTWVTNICNHILWTSLILFLVNLITWLVLRILQLYRWWRNRRKQPVVPTV